MGLLALVALAPPLRAQDLKIGFVNSEELLEGYTGTRDAETAYRADVESWNREAREMVGRIEIASTSPSSQFTVFTNRSRLR